MSEQSLVDTLLSAPIDFPWKAPTEIHYATELKITQNRVDIVYYQHAEASGVGSVIAVEAKLRDWRKAIQQAYRDKLFANRAYVALPEQFASSAITNIEEFQRADVGLIVVDLGGKTHVYHHPSSNTPISAHHSRIAKNSLSVLTRD